MTGSIGDPGKIGMPRLKMKIMVLTIYTLIHVAVSLAGIVTGVVVLLGLLTGKRFDSWTALFLATTAATSVTGFFFPFHGLTPAIVTGIISLLLLSVAAFARYARRLARAWRQSYVINAVIVLYLNVFVLIAQAFQKIAALKAFAPTQTEPPFKFAQIAVLAVFVFLTIVAAIKFREIPVRTIPGIPSRGSL